MKTITTSTIQFNTSTVEKIVSNPEVLLTNMGVFWKDEIPQQLVVKWHENAGIDIDYYDQKKI